MRAPSHPKPCTDPCRERLLRVCRLWSAGLLAACLGAWGLGVQAQPQPGSATPAVLPATPAAPTAPLAPAAPLSPPTAASAAGTGAAPSSSTAAESSVSRWLERLHQATRNRAYVGTFVFSNGSEIASARIWHVCDGRQQFERIEALSGAPRITMRRNDEVAIFLPAHQLVYKDRRAALRAFPDVLHLPGRRIDAHYSVRAVGKERVAGHDALVVDFIPADALRYGYRIWSEQRSGLMLKLQTRNGQGRVLEQVAFTELQLDAPVRIETLARQFEQTAGLRVVTPVLRASTSQEQGWRLRQEVPGFQPVALHLRSERSGIQRLQWVFSDGLASVSLFIEHYDAQRHVREAALADGATHTLARRVGEHWVTAVGEVPPETLQQHIQALERVR